MTKKKTQQREDKSIRAQQFAQVRSDHRKEIAEDYVELIKDLSQDKLDVRAVDVAEYFGVSQATVNKNIKRLIEDGYVVSQPYRSIYLTNKGKDLAIKCKKRHKLVIDWLLSIGVSEETAKRDAEGIEHHISDETLTAIRKFIENTG